MTGPSRLATREFLRLWAGAIGFGLVLGRAGFPSTFLAAGALALVGGALGADRFRR